MWCGGVGCGMMWWDVVGWGVVGGVWCGVVWWGRCKHSGLYKTNQGNESLRRRHPEMEPNGNGGFSDAEISCSETRQWPLDTDPQEEMNPPYTCAVKFGVLTSRNMRE